VSTSAGVEVRGRSRSSLAAARDLARHLAGSRRWALALLAVLSLVSLGARSAWLGLPCDRPCSSVGQHRLIFDENYYVNAARAIAGVPVSAGAQYAGVPVGVDPNSEHPQLAKLIIAGAIRTLGDGPLAWRAGSLLMGSLALLGLFALVRAAGGRRPLALGAAALMATDNLLLVHGRLATLDVYALAPMVWAAALYLRGRRVAAGVLLGVGACMKLVALYLLVVLALLEALRLLNEGRGPFRRDVRQAVSAAGRRLAACAAAAGASFLILLGLLDRLVPPYDPVAHRVITGGPLAHALHMLRFAAGQTSPHGPTGISSYPWAWLADFKPIVYSDIGLVNPANRRLVLAPTGHFLAFISPPVLLFALPALGLALWGVRHRRASPTALLGAAWLLGAFVPFALLSLAAHRTSYLYYMVVVMPGVYLLVGSLFARPGMPRWARLGWIAAVAVAAVALYPFTPLPYLG
jgi:4-amino-4-deoxy-L-arabinose transferase-like glycosyltransferase